MGYFEIRVTVNRPLSTVFSVYTDLEKWTWSSAILKASWVVGRPWEEESRMRLVLDGPVGSTVDQVLTHFEPLREIAYLSHFSGITMETRLSFRSASEHSTELHGRMEFLGTLSRVVGFAVEPAIERGTKQFFDDLKKHCESMPLAEDGSDLPDSIAPDSPCPTPEAG
jgi:hypothetical protein